MNNLLDKVITSKEISELYPISDCTIRIWIKQGVLSKGCSIRKSGNIWLIEKEFIEKMMKERGIFNKTFVVEKEKISTQFFFKNKNFEIWVEDNSKIDVCKIPFKNIIPQIFNIYRNEKKMNFKYLIIRNNIEKSDNDYYPIKKIWVITLRGLLDIYRNNLLEHKIDTHKLDEFISWQNYLAFNEN